MGELNFYDQYWYFNRESYNDRFESFLTNFERSQLPIYKKAINDYSEVSNDKTFYIKNEAYAQNGVLLHSHYSLHFKVNNGSQDCSLFWNIFDGIRNKYPSHFSNVNPKKPITFKSWCESKQKIYKKEFTISKDQFWQ